MLEEASPHDNHGGAVIHDDHDNDAVDYVNDYHFDRHNLHVALDVLDATIGSHDDDPNGDIVNDGGTRTA